MIGPARLVPVHRSMIVCAATSVVLLVGTAFLAVRGFSVDGLGTRTDCGSVIRPSPQGLDGRCGTQRSLRESYVAFSLTGAFVLQIVFLAGLVSKLRAPEFEAVGPRVSVRRVRSSDADAVTSTVDALVMAEMGWKPEHLLNLGEGVRSGTIVTDLVVVERGSRRVVGVISTAADATTLHGLHVGMWMGPANRGAGLMSEAMRLFADTVTAEGSPVRAETASSNVAAQRVLERAGLELEGTRRVRLPNGTEVDGRIYARYVDAAAFTESARAENKAP